MERLFKIFKTIIFLFFFGGIKIIPPGYIKLDFTVPTKKWKATHKKMENNPQKKWKARTRQNRRIDELVNKNHT